MAKLKYARTCYSFGVWYMPGYYYIHILQNLIIGQCGKEIGRGKY